MLRTQAIGWTATAAIFLAGFCAVSGQSWSYADQDAWVNDYPDCGGSNQSPVLINASAGAPGRYDQMFFTEGFFQDIVWKIEFEGHFFQVVFDPDVEGQASPIYDMEMSGGPMGSDVYVFDRIWLKLGDSGRHSYEHITIKPGNGVNDTAGAEGEFQIVLRKKGIADYETALNTKPDGLFIIALPFFKENEPISQSGLQSNFPLLRHIFRTSKRLQKRNKEFVDFNRVVMRIGDLFNDVLFWYEYALYDGSITHPPCTESVRWMVLYNYVNIAENHLRFLKSFLREEVGPRALQDLGSRSVEHVSLDPDARIKNV